MTTPLRSNAVDRNSAHRPTWTLTCLPIIQRGAAEPVFSDCLVTGPISATGNKG